MSRVHDLRVLGSWSKRSSTRNRRLGFSLIELMVVLTIATVILAVGIPQYVRNNRRQQVKAAADQLGAAIRLAHTSAQQNADGAQFTGTLPTTPTETGQYELYLVRQGTVVSAPVARGDTGLALAGTLVQQSYSQASPMQSSQPVLGAVLVVQGQPLAFGQDGSLVPAPSSPMTIVLANGYATYQLSVSSLGGVTETELP